MPFIPFPFSSKPCILTLECFSSRLDHNTCFWSPTDIYGWFWYSSGKLRCVPRFANMCISKSDSNSERKDKKERHSDQYISDTPVGVCSLMFSVVFLFPGSPFICMVPFLVHYSLVRNLFGLDLLYLHCHCDLQLYGYTRWVMTKFSKYYKKWIYIKMIYLIRWCMLIYMVINLYCIKRATLYNDHEQRNAINIGPLMQILLEETLVWPSPLLWCSVECSNGVLDSQQKWKTRWPLWNAC